VRRSFVDETAQTKQEFSQERFKKRQAHEPGVFLGI
jgi:hypothetical protein